MASGDFTVKATFNEPKYMNLNSRLQGWNDLKLFMGSEGLQRLEFTRDLVREITG